MYKRGGEGRKYKIIILRVVKFSRETLFCHMVPSAYLRHLNMMINLSNEKIKSLVIDFSPTIHNCSDVGTKKVDSWAQPTLKFSS